MPDKNKTTEMAGDGPNCPAPPGSTFTVGERAANQAARAVVKEIERHTGKSVSLYNAMRLTQCLGAALELNGIRGGPPGDIRTILEEPYRPDTDRSNVERTNEATATPKTKGNQW